MSDWSNESGLDAATHANARGLLAALLELDALPMDDDEPATIRPRLGAMATLVCAAQPIGHVPRCPVHIPAPPPVSRTRERDDYCLC
ncbi:hypothetical protein [Laribacter hongkongensis]|uniref:hypothetical protein n=1 Tax=Laribacter hongkongensis TaxID=168471 RepID=UPI001EFD6A8C|nr:hypothetical protein [Laribacter hongkongensis]MCG9080240.1 hypothetical protein [Laribacter hongkongensis]